MSLDCFPEPDKSDPTPARRAESTPAWLARSTWIRAVACRRFYNHNLSALPADIAATLCRRLRHDASMATHFELVVGRFLQELGALQLRHEVKGAEGMSVDWTAEFAEGGVAVEATAPVVNTAVGKATKDAGPLLELVSRMTPVGWHVVVLHAPPLASGERPSRIRRALADVFASLPQRPRPGLLREVSLTLSQGVLQLDLIAASDPELKTSDVSGPMVGYIDNMSEVVHRAVTGKRRQVRGAGMPVLAAVYTGGFGDHEIEKFDIALFGRTVVRQGSDERWIDRSGAFGRGRGEPTFAGALVFAELGWRGGPDPVLYLHPRLTGGLPDAVMSLRRRTLTESEIVDFPAQRDGVLMRLGWPSS